MATGTILVVEDERSISSLVEMYLRKEGYEVVCVDDGAAAVEAARTARPALVVLDVMLPGMDGLEICRRLRARSAIPIIMLTARDTDVDRIIGLEIGADDYVTKPFNPRELVARVKAVLRRSEPAPEDRLEDTFTLGPVFIDVARRLVRVGERAVELTPKEFDLLAFLARNRGIVFGRDRLLERVWDYERAIDTRTVDSHVRSLRAKLGEDAQVVKTIRGVGYKAET
ncbi:MAG TPA: response regulator transcription factor [Actinomycetota bacterium]|nr:response regulator transcription factor [Actinomycetota bacterium]